MSCCDKCRSESYEIKPFRLVGGFRTYLCRACVQSADEYLMGIRATDDINVFEVRLAAAIHKGNGQLAATLQTQICTEKIRLWHISQAWVKGETE